MYSFVFFLLASKFIIKGNSYKIPDLNPNHAKEQISLENSFSTTQSFPNSNQNITASPSPTINTGHVPSVGLICGTCAACFVFIIIVSSILCFRKEPKNTEIVLGNSAIQEMVNNQYQEIA